jgi:hypothetical protein
MPSIIYGGVRYFQVRHAMYCKKCSDTVESRSGHDFRFCKCGAVGVDGGIEGGNRVLGKLTDMEDRRMYVAYIHKKKLWLPQSVIEEQFAELGAQNNNMIQ